MSVKNWSWKWWLPFAINSYFISRVWWLWCLESNLFKFFVAPSSFTFWTFFDWHSVFCNDNLWGRYIKYLSLDYCYYNTYITPTSNPHPRHEHGVGCSSMFSGCNTSWSLCPGWPFSPPDARFPFSLKLFVRIWFDFLSPLLVGGFELVVLCNPKGLSSTAICSRSAWFSCSNLSIFLIFFFWIHPCLLDLFGKLTWCQKNGRRKFWPSTKRKNPLN